MQYPNVFVRMPVKEAVKPVVVVRSPVLAKTRQRLKSSIGQRWRRVSSGTIEDQFGFRIEEKNSKHWLYKGDRFICACFSEHAAMEISVTMINDIILFKQKH